MMLFPEITACATHCAQCNEAGAGKCDAQFYCDAGYWYNPVDRTCTGLYITTFRSVIDSHYYM